MNDLLNQLLVSCFVDTENGLIYRRGRGRHDISVRQAGTVRRDGYREINLNGKLYLAHRLIWLTSTGGWPNGCIDHINGNRADNRVLNLRDVDNSKNLQNAKRKKSNSSGFTGVSWHKASKMYLSRITINGKHISLGYFKDIESAARARASSELMLYGEYSSLHTVRSGELI